MSCTSLGSPLRLCSIPFTHPVVFVGKLWIFDLTMLCAVVIFGSPLPVQIHRCWWWLRGKSERNRFFLSLWFSLLSPTLLPFIPLSYLRRFRDLVSIRGWENSFELTSRWHMISAAICLYSLFFIKGGTACENGSWNGQIRSANEDQRHEAKRWACISATFVTMQPSKGGCCLVTSETSMEVLWSLKLKLRAELEDAFLRERSSLWTVKHLKSTGLWNKTLEYHQLNSVSVYQCITSQIWTRRGRMSNLDFGVETVTSRPHQRHP